MASFRWRGVAAALVMLAVFLVAGPVAARESRPEGIGPPPAAPTGILINIAARTLYWYEDSKLVRSFPVGVGTAGTRTPVGKYAVEDKAKFPWWQPPWGGAVVPPGPQNPLGTRWIQFHGGYGIHGNNSPASIGGYVSHGCVRMYGDDVEWLYDQVQVGTPIQVVYEPVQIQAGADGRRYLAMYEDGYERGSLTPAEVLKAAGFAPDTVPGTRPGLYLLDIRVDVNGREVPAILHRGRPYVAARDLAGKLSARTGWNDATHTVALDGQDLPTVVQGSTGYVDAAAAAAVLGVEYTWDAEAGVARFTGEPLFLNGHLLARTGRRLDGQLLAPVRLVAEAAGAAVTWDDTARQAVLNGERLPSVLVGSRAFAEAELLGLRLGLQVRLGEGALSFDN
jgi:hypothetical protein